MNEESEVDPELAALRARRIQELLNRTSAPNVAAPPVPSRPTDLSGRSFSPFLQQHPRVVVDVWAPWCGPCRTMAPILDGLAREFAGSVAFGKLNADNEPGIAGQFGVEGIPTLLLFDRGRLVDRVVGAVPADALRGRLRAVFGLQVPPKEDEN